MRFEGLVFQIPNRSPFVWWAHKRVDLHVLLDSSVEIFYQKDRIARFDLKTAHRIGLYRTNGIRKVSSYGPETTSPKGQYELSP